MLQPEVKWFVVMTEPRAEAAAARDLRRRGYKTLFLHTSEWVKSSRARSKLVKRPVLPGYIFVGLTPDQFEGGRPMLHDASTAHGVSALVRAPGGVPLPVPHAAMQELTWNADTATGLVLDGTPKPEFEGKPGDTVRLGDTTPYFGFLSEIQKVDQSGKITILIEAFGRKVPTTIDPEDVGELIPTSGAS
jgi:transcription antitermination factor NusG